MSKYVESPNKLSSKLSIVTDSEGSKILNTVKTSKLFVENLI